MGLAAPHVFGCGQTQQYQRVQESKHVSLSSLSLYQFAGATITKYHRLAGLNNSLFSQSCGGVKIKIKKSAGLISSEASLGLAHACFLPFVHMIVCLVFLSLPKSL